MDKIQQDTAAPSTGSEEVQRALARGGLVDITTVGRRTGQPHRIEIVFHNIDGRVYVSGIPRRRRRSWLANLEANPRFKFHLKRQVQADLEATARIVTDEDERRQILSQVARNWGRDDPETVETMVRYSPLIEARFQAAA